MIAWQPKPDTPFPETPEAPANSPSRGHMLTLEELAEFIDAIEYDELRPDRRAATIATPRIRLTPLLSAARRTMTMRRLRGGAHVAH